MRQDGLFALNLPMYNCCYNMFITSGLLMSVVVMYHEQDKQKYV